VNVSRDDAGLINGHLRDVVYDEDSFTLATICGLDDPCVYVFWNFLRWLAVYLVLLLAKLVEMGVEISEFIRQIISVWDDVECLLSKLLLHLDNI